MTIVYIRPFTTNTKLKEKKNQQCAQEIPSGNMIIFVTFLCTVTTYLGRGNLREEILFWFTV